MSDSAMITLSQLLHYLVFGSDVQVLSSDWLIEKCPQHEQWTQSQQQPGMALVITDSAAMRRRAFWQARERPKSAVSPFQKRSA